MYRQSSNLKEKQLHRLLVKWKIFLAVLEPHMGGWKAYLSSKLLHLQEQALEDWCQGQNILALVPFALIFSLGFFLSVLVCINLESAFTHCNTNMQVQYRAGWDHHKLKINLNWTEQSYCLCEIGDTVSSEKADPG